MTEYRVYTVGIDGHLVDFRGFVAENDENALVWAGSGGMAPPWKSGAASALSCGLNPITSAIC
jgi:hypothetical protein